MSNEKRDDLLLFGEHRRAIPAGFTRYQQEQEQQLTRQKVG